MILHIEDSNRFGALSMHRLEAFEKELGTALPEPYRQFLIQHNGGYPSGAKKLYALDQFYGLHDGPDWARFPDRRLLAQFIPPRMLVIADDPGGNHYCLSLGPPDRGSVYLWDPECAYQGDGAFQLLADDFHTFLKGLAWKAAIFERDEDAVRAEIQAGRDIDRPIYAGKSLLVLAAELGRFNILKILADAGASIPPATIIEAVRYLKLRAVRYLLRRGCSVNYIDRETGFTPLMMVASGDGVEIAEYLLAHGADPSAVNKWGKRAVDLAHTSEMRDAFAQEG